MKVKIPNSIPKMKKPTIPFTNIPNPFGSAVITYKDGNKYVIPFYYLQDLFLKLKEFIIKIIVISKYKKTKHFKH